MSHQARKVLLMQNLREANPRLNIEDLLELMRIVAQEEIYEADQEGCFDHSHEEKQK